MGFLAAFSASVMQAGCATGQIDLTAEAPAGGVATITGARKFTYLVFYIYLRECGITQVDYKGMDKFIGAKTVKVPEGRHRLSVNCRVSNADEKWFGDNVKRYEGDLSFFARAGHEYTVDLKGACIVAIDNANEAVVKSDCEPSTG